MIIYIDNKPYEAEEGKNLLEACLALGFDLPYFCWHPALHSVGACRQCAVKLYKDEEDTKGRIVMSCMTPVRDGMRLSVSDPEAVAFRKGVIEFLMANHPHDCPVCDEGGECHLQDMTLMTGHVYRAHRFTKRTHRNQNLGPLVNHEMNRCIACYRCVRFYRDYAGGRDLDVFAWHDSVYFGRAAAGTLESEFSGNLVEVCPTGVFTDKTFRKHYTRPWDLQTAPSVCVHCSVGCNTLPGERYGSLRRIRNRYNYDVNGWFLCDRGRYGYEFVNGPARIRTAAIRNPGSAPEQAALGQVITAVAESCAGGGRVIGIGSPRASLESNFALRQLVGADNYCNGLSQRDSEFMAAALELMRNTPARIATLREDGEADAVVILGEDVLNTAPMLGLGIRQAVFPRRAEAVKALGIEAWDDAAVRRALLQAPKTPFYIATPAATKFDGDATGTFRGTPDAIARIAFGAANMIDPAAPVPSLTSGETAAANALCSVLATAKRPLIVWGVSLRSMALIKAAEALTRALHRKRVAVMTSAVFPECNSLGSALLGGMSLDACLDKAAGAKPRALIVMENDLFRRTGRETAEKLLKTAELVVAIDHSENETTRAATILLPGAAFAEATGTLVSSEGRAQRFFKVYPPAGDVKESWKWLGEIMAAKTGRGWANFDELSNALAAAVPGLAHENEAAPEAGFRMAGQKVPRQSHRYSGRTAIQAAVDVMEPQPPTDPDSPFTFSMEGAHLQPPPALIPRYQMRGWNSVQALTFFQNQPGGRLRGGESGRRLIEPAGSIDEATYGELPADIGAQLRPDDTLLGLPVHHIFGSEEQSMLSPAIASLAPQPYIALGSGAAEKFGLAEGRNVEVTCKGSTVILTCKIVAGMAEGVAGIPVGLPGMPYLDLPQPVGLRPVERDHE